MKEKMFKVCRTCVDDLRYLSQGSHKLNVSSYPSSHCFQKPRCFDQPSRIKEKDLQ